MLGKGGFARVYHCTERSTGRVLACKVITHASITKPRQRRKLCAEIQIQQALVHKHIVRFEGFFSDTDNTYLLMELCNNKTLLDMLKHRGRLTEREVRYWLCQAVSALRYMHSQLVIHRDLKLGNMFIHDMQLKIGDFGLAAKLDNPFDRKRTICGTPNYIAPEVLESPNGHSFEADVWSLGVVAYTLLVGFPPFETKDVQKTYGLIKANSYSFPRDKPISDDARDLIRSILKSSPTERLRIDQILSHRFFAEPVPSSLPVHALRAEPAIPALSPSKSRLRYEHVPPSPTRRVTSAATLATAAAPAPSAMQQQLAEDEPENNPNNQVQRLPRSPQHTASPSKRRLPPPALPSQPTATQAGAMTGPALNSCQLALLPEALELANLAKALSTQQPVVFDGIPATARTSSACFIRKWADYTEKYGIGFLTSTGSVGAFFNDTTKMFLTPSGREVGFVSVGNTQLITLAATASKSDLDHDLNKKLTLMRYFQGLFLPGFNPENASAAMTAAATPSTAVPFFVTHYYKTSTAMVFRFSTGELQANFTDHVKLIVHPGWDRPVRFLDVNDPIPAFSPSTTTTAQREITPTNPQQYISYVQQFIRKLQNRSAAGSSTATTTTKRQQTTSTALAATGSAAGTSSRPLIPRTLVR